MNIIPTSLKEVLIIEPSVFKDPRGFFMETFQENRYRESGIDRHFVQDNLSFSVRGTLRGLHYQIRHPQAKLVQAVSGEIFDVAVDIRPGSPTFGKWTGVILSDQNHRQLFIPEGFAHGFCVLSKTAHFLYKCSDFYAADDEGGILWFDPEIGIQWPVEHPSFLKRPLSPPCPMRSGSASCGEERKMNILIVGSKGQLGWELMRQGADFTLLGLDLPELDITRPESIAECAKDFRPDLLINAAAYTNVDKSESDTQTAFAVNKDGAANLADFCKTAKIPLIHISTDFVFDGKKTSPYLESDPVSPLGVYGKSKAEGEEEVRNRRKEHIIVRTAWLYGVHGHNFVKTMIRLGQEREKLGVVADQHGCPTCAADLAEALLRIAQQIGSGKNVSWGTYHYCGKGITSWHGFTEKIIETARQYFPMRTKQVNAITTDQYPTPAQRPAYSALDCTRIQANFGVETKDWKESLKKTIAQMADSDFGGTAN
ncbi:MAG: dTDP-4-dehydrorhamnose reductase [Desulfobacterales bacterium]